jgi:type I restriction enzyme S subunit
MNRLDDAWERVTVDQIKAPTASAIAIGPFGSRMKSDTYTPSGVPVVRGNNISDTTELKGEFVFISPDFADELSGCKLEPGDLFFPHCGNIGEVGIISGKQGHRFMMSTSLMKLSPDPRKADPFFLFYFFRSPAGRHKLLANASQVGTPGIATPLTSLRSITVTLPPLAVQNAIAELLMTIDDKIDLNRHINATLEAIARAFFQAWFVDIEPERGIERGWRTEKLEEVARINENKVTKDHPHAEIQYIDISSVTSGRLEGISRYAWAEAPSRAQRLVKHGDTIWSCVRPNRKSYLFIHEPPSDLVVSTGFAVLSPQRVTPSYLHAWVTSEEFVDYLTNHADGSAYPAVRPDDFARAEILVPDLETLQRFESMVAPMRTLIARNEQESRTLTDLRDMLLPKLMSGEVRVRP